MTKTYTIETLAKAIADDLNEAVASGGFDNFKEMRGSYSWTAKEIKNEIRGTAMFLLNQEYKDLCNEYGGWEEIPWEISENTVDIYDDGTLEQGMTTVGYGAFKKMVMNQVK